VRSGYAIMSVTAYSDAPSVLHHAAAVASSGQKIGRRHRVYNKVFSTIRFHCAWLLSCRVLLLISSTSQGERFLAVWILVKDGH